MLANMKNIESLSQPQLLELLGEQQIALAQRDQQLAAATKEIDAAAKEIARRDEQLADSQRELADSQKEIARDKDVIRQLEEKNRQLEKDYAQLYRERFGRKSERYIADPDQLRIDFGDTDDAADAADGLAEAVEEAELQVKGHTRQKRRSNNAFPAHLPRVEKVRDADAADKICPEHGEKQLLPESMWDVLEKMVLIPPRLEVHVIKYKKYACKNQPQCGVASAERPTGIVEGDKYDTSVATQIITHKYAYFLTLYRLQNMFAGSGWAPSRSLMLNILINCAMIIEPLLAYFKRVLQDDSIVACDDTGIKLLYPKVPPNFDLNDPKQKRAAEVFDKALKEKKSSINAKMWAYRGVNVKLNVFDFTVSRHRDGPELFFENFSGTILGDCWHGFGAIAANSDGSIVRAACNAHARRKFEQATDYPADRKKWLDWYWQLYDFESEAKEESLAGDALLSHRRSKQKPVWDAMRMELDSIDDRTEHVVLPKSDLRKALNYLDNHWAELTRYLDDPQLPLDNNDCEQLMREVAIGRKNWIFAGSLVGGERNAGFLTLVSSAHRNNIDVWAYVDDVLKRLLAGETDYEPLLPWNWAAAHPESIRTYREQERQDKQIRQREKRQARRRADRTPPLPG